MGHHVVVACNGLEAVEHARESAYDLILMDLQMPVMDGITATQSIRQLPAYDQIPIVAVTAQSLPEDRERCFAAGMQDHLSKPFTTNQLRDTIEAVMSACHNQQSPPNITS